MLQGDVYIPLKFYTFRIRSTTVQKDKAAIHIEGIKVVSWLNNGVLF